MIVTWLCPAGMVPLKVPPRVPAPDLTLSVTAVLADTGVATELPFRDSTTTAKGEPAVGLAPPFTCGMARVTGPVKLLAAVRTNCLLTVSKVIAVLVTLLAKEPLSTTSVNAPLATGVALEMAST